MSGENVIQLIETLSRCSTKAAFLPDFSGRNLKCSQSGAKVQSAETDEGNGFIATKQTNHNVEVL